MTTTKRTRDEALMMPMPGDVWQGPTLKILVTETRDSLDEGLSVVFCAAHKDHELKPAFTRKEALDNFIKFVGNGELVATQEAAR
jgi:hypothetical protein